MSENGLGLIGDPESKYDRFVLKTFAICFQLAEIMLIIGAFRYAGERTGNAFLTGFASVLGFVGAMWLGLVIPGTIGRLEFWKSTSPRVRLAFAIAVIIVSGYGGFLYLQAIASIAKAQAQ